MGICRSSTIILWYLIEYGIEFIHFIGVDQMLDMVVCLSSLIKQQKKIKKIYLSLKVISNLVFILFCFFLNLQLKNRNWLIFSLWLTTLCKCKLFRRIFTLRISKYPRYFCGCFKLLHLLPMPYIDIKMHAYNVHLLSNDYN